MHAEYFIGYQLQCMTDRALSGGWGVSSVQWNVVCYEWGAVQCVMTICVGWVEVQLWVECSWPCVQDVSNLYVLVSH